MLSQITAYSSTVSSLLTLLFLNSRHCCPFLYLKGEFKHQQVQRSSKTHVFPNRLTLQTALCFSSACVNVCIFFVCTCAETCTDTQSKSKQSTPWRQPCVLGVMNSVGCFLCLCVWACNDLWPVGLLRQSDKKWVNIIFLSSVASLFWRKRLKTDPKN